MAGFPLPLDYGMDCVSLREGKLGKGKSGHSGLTPETTCREEDSSSKNREGDVFTGCGR